MRSLSARASAHALLVPAEGVRVDQTQGLVRAPYDRELIYEAPRQPSGVALSPERKREVYVHYGPKVTNGSTAFGTEAAGTRAGEPGVIEERPARTGAVGQPRESAAGEVEMPIEEERLRVGKREVGAERVRLRKVVRTDQVNVPVELRQEDVVVERVPAKQVRWGRSLAQSLRQHLYAWMSFAALVGWVLSRLPPKKQKLYVLPAAGGHQSPGRKTVRPGQQHKGKGTPKILSLAMPLLTAVGMPLLKREVKAWRDKLFTPRDPPAPRRASARRASGQNARQGRVNPPEEKGKTKAGQRRPGKFSPAHALDLLKTTAAQWAQDKCPQLGAALAYYTVFSLAPLVLVLLAVFGLLFGGSEHAREKITEQLRYFLDPMFYAAQIMLFGAEFTQVYANAYGSHVQPEAHAVKVERKEIEVPTDKTP